MMKRSNVLMAKADPTLQYPLLKALWLQIFITFGLFFVRLIMRIARGAEGESCRLPVCTPADRNRCLRNRNQKGSILWYL